MTANAPRTFDAGAFKATTRAQWEDASAAWHRWGPHIEAWLGDATDAMLDAARIGDGDAVLDVAAGAGGQSLAAARRVGPNGSVLATDISPAILAHAASEARAFGLHQVTTLECDGEALDVTAGAFDAAISRVGLIYFPDQQAALTSIRRALRSGGRLAAVVYTTPDRNEFFSIPVGIVRRRAGLPTPAPGQPGPFSLGAPGVVEDQLTAAGYTEIETQIVPSPLCLRSADECVRFERESFGALHQMLAGLDPAEQDDTWAEIEQALHQFDGPDGFVAPCEMLVASATGAPS